MPQPAQGGPELAVVGIEPSQGRRMEDTVMSLRSWLHFGRIAGLVDLLWSAPMRRAAEAQEYGFAEAAQEITQLFWLAETATACGWASAEDSARFKYFSV